MKKLPTIIVAIIFLSVGCSKTTKESAASGNKVGSAASDTVIRVAYLPTLDALPYFVAMDRGMFEGEGLSVELVRFQAHMDIDTALTGGSVDGAFTDIIRSERLQQRDSVKLSYITSTEASWALISNRTARLNRLEQFGDKMVASTRFSATDYLTDMTFKDIKTKAVVFKVQINDVDLRLRMLQNNEMDAMWLPEPQATEALLSKHKQVVAASKNKEKLGVLAFRGLTGKKGGAEALDKMAKVYSMACDSINKNGVKAYAAELQKYCGVDTTVVVRLPKTRFAKAVKPTDEMIESYRKYLKQ